MQAGRLCFFLPPDLHTLKPARISAGMSASVAMISMKRRIFFLKEFVYLLAGEVTLGD